MPLKYFTPFSSTRGLAHIMLEDWEIEHAVEDNDFGKTRDHPKSTST